MKYFSYKIIKIFYAVSYFNKKYILLHYALNPLFEKTKEKVRQGNPKWTFLKCPKSKFPEYFYKQLFWTDYYLLFYKNHRKKGILYNYCMVLYK